eukprot:scaffold6847_cov64-Phaeocystis_antarctica.AAC.11
MSSLPSCQKALEREGQVFTEDEPSFARGGASRTRWRRSVSSEQTFRHRAPWKALPLQTGTNHCDPLCPPFTPLALYNNRHATSLLTVVQHGERCVPVPGVHQEERYLAGLETILGDEGLPHLPHVAVTPHGARRVDVGVGLVEHEKCLDGARQLPVHVDAGDDDLRDDDLIIPRVEARRSPQLAVLRVPLEKELHVRWAIRRGVVVLGNPPFARGAEAAGHAAEVLPVVLIAILLDAARIRGAVDEKRGRVFAVEALQRDLFVA